MAPVTLCECDQFLVRLWPVGVCQCEDQGCSLTPWTNRFSSSIALSVRSRLSPELGGFFLSVLDHELTDAGGAERGTAQGECECAPAAVEHLGLGDPVGGRYRAVGEQAL